MTIRLLKHLTKQTGKHKFALKGFAPNWARHVKAWARLIRLIWLSTIIFPFVISDLLVLKSKVANTTSKEVVAFFLR